MSPPAGHGPAPGATRIPINTPGGRYDVVIAHDGLDALGELILRALPAQPARGVLIADRGLPASIVDRAEASLRGAGLEPVTLTAEATESAKSMETATALLRAVAAARLERDEPVIALGGGLVGDVAGFVASIYRRGVPSVLCPTTLLAMVDASVGGKTGVNLAPEGETGLRKNMVGTFHQPALVLADTALLGPLPERAFRAGLGECVKHAMLGADQGDPDLLGWIETQAGAILSRTPGTLDELVARNVRIKAGVVAADERETAESGGRALLNLGHTFAHAIETDPSLSPTGKPGDAPLQHGEAVGLGLVAACHLGVSLGLLDAASAERVERLLVALGLPIRLDPGPDPDRVLDAMGHDKKVRGGRWRLVVPCGPGRARVVTDPPSASVRGAIEAWMG